MSLLSGFREQMLQKCPKAMQCEFCHDISDGPEPEPYYACWNECATIDSLLAKTAIIQGEIGLLRKELEESGEKGGEQEQ